MEGQPILQTEKLSKHFGALTTAHEVDFEVHQGEIHSIIGPNGDGKTTFLTYSQAFFFPHLAILFTTEKKLQDFRLIRFHSWVLAVPFRSSIFSQSFLLWRMSGLRSNPERRSIIVFGVLLENRDPWRRRQTKCFSESD